MADNEDTVMLRSPVVNRRTALVGFILVALIAAAYFYTGDRSGDSSYTNDSAAMSQPANASVRPLPVSSVSNPVVRFNSNIGILEVELFPEHAPAVVSRFLGLVESGYFETDTVLESQPGVGFVIARVGADAEVFHVAESESGRLASQRGSVAVLDTSFSTAYLNNIYVGYKGNVELEGNYTIFGQVTSGLDDVEKNSRGQTGQIKAVTAVKGDT